MPKNFVPQDIELEKIITAINVNVEKEIAVCAVKAIDTESDGYFSTLWEFSLNGKHPRQLTFGSHMDISPRYSHDGSQLAFLSDRAGDGTSQVHILPMDGGEARQLGHLAGGASEVWWRPQGDRLLVLASVTVDPDRRKEGCMRWDGADAPARKADAPHLCWRLPYKMNGTGYLLDARTHLFMLDAAEGKPRQLTAGDFNVHSAAWAPDGKRLCFCRTREEEGQQHCTDIWLLDLEGDKPAQCMRLSSGQNNCSSPSWSPDGKWIVFAGAQADGDAQMRLWLIDMDGRQVRPLGDESIEVVAGELHWKKDSTAVAFIQAIRGLQSVVEISVPTVKTRPLAQGERQVGILAANDFLVYSSEDLVSAQELYCRRWDGQEEETQLSHFNPWWQERDRLHAEHRVFDVPAGGGSIEKIDGWLLALRDGDGLEKARPLLIDIHGGPASYVDFQFSSHAYWQILCSRGWTVLALNAVGSSSYGRDFSERLRGKWGELDLPQHLGALGQLQQQGIAREAAIIGNSYGGYMAAYAIGHSDRFKAAIVSAPVANLESHFGTSDSGYYADTYSMEVDEEESHHIFHKLSPASSIDKAKTPTLFLQGMEDERCPRAQTEELFVKLRYTTDTPTEMVLYPGGDHSFAVSGKPAHRVDALQRILQWLEKWVTDK
ncbi:S9 family peptidase [Comamonas sp. w2-DMI]|uniref:S9 family peptidase n=1 Tax=Comamonas sp. w2-DMI TaxID=3126391 RepID=UPI0032E3DE8E